MPSPQMRVGIAQINARLGDFSGNSKKIIEFSERAAAKRCQLVVFPECSLFGYHPFDFLEREESVNKQLLALHSLNKRIPSGLAVLVGLITKNPAPLGRPYYNSAALLVRGKKPKFFHKQLLPTGDVFDEARFIEPGNLKNNYFKLNDHTFFLSICEDIWAWPENKKSPYASNPIEELPRKKVDLIINMSASPFFIGKMKKRLFVTQKTAEQLRAPLLYANLVGAQDEIIFDGASFIVEPNGKKILQCYSFREDLNVFDLNEKSAWHQARPLKPMEEMRSALVLGIQDFVHKIGLNRVHIGISGGIDSAIVAALAADALGPNQVTGFALPGPFSASKSHKLAKRLCENLGIELRTIDINTLYSSYLRLMKKQMGIKKFGLVHENLQARIRGNILMAFANVQPSLLLATGNKSEFSTGYSTLYGDMCGGLAPIGDLTKSQVYDLARYYNHQQEVIPVDIINRPPSAELRPNQRDQDSLPPYPKLDASIVKIVEQGKQASSQLDLWLLQKMFATEFKRWQAPPILKISSHSFGRGRRYPIALKA